MGSCDFSRTKWCIVSLRLPLLWRDHILLSVGIHMYRDDNLFTSGVSIAVSSLTVGKSLTAISNMTYINARLHPSSFSWYESTRKTPWPDNVRLCMCRVYRTWKRLNVNIRLTFAVTWVSSTEYDSLFFLRKPIVNS